MKNNVLYQSAKDRAKLTVVFVATSLLFLFVGTVSEGVGMVGLLLLLGSVVTSLVLIVISLLGLLLNKKLVYLGYLALGLLASVVPLAAGVYYFAPTGI
ncbi:hypothetical protein ACSLBF_09235 [Pseudoalteromonas sp. T1lg65]|uniref:hypothetical protein n=1 Tax=Pseudoalteromonas sp. T1lg65 TaxID=2077101 RepID=UPI003F79220B